MARDRTGKTLDFVTGRAPLTRVNLRRCLAPVTARDTLLVTDVHPACRAYSLEGGISRRAVNLCRITSDGAGRSIAYGSARPSC